jgi:phage terminase Nu1 subunit (DNA packaging protein)
MSALPKLATLARELGVTKGRISQMKAAGMPVNSVAAAKEWKAANVRARFDVDREAADPVAVVTYDIAEARAKREHHEANIAAMREAQLAGDLVERKRVESALVGIAAQVRANFERLPDKLAEVLAAETDAHQAHALLTAEIDLVLEDLAAQVNAVELADAGRH